MKYVFAATLISLFTSQALAENWPQWRGPEHNGVAQGDNYPTHWGQDKNVLWKVALPGRSGSTPVIWGDNIFVTSPSEGKNTLISFDRQGNEQWRVHVGDERIGKHRQKGSGSNPSPTTDGQHVFAYFKSGDLACIDFAGEIVWKTNVQARWGEDTLWWDLGTSPILTDDAVAVTVMQTGPSYLAAFDKSTGELLWKQDRVSDAPEEAAQSYSTPILASQDGRSIIVVLGADIVTAHDAASGDEIWRVTGLNPTQHHYFRSIASPVQSDGIVVVPYARGGSLTAIRLGGKGDVTDSHIAWFKERISSDVPSPAAHNGRLYLCTDKGEAACLDIKTGDVLWQDRLEKSRHSFSSSPVIAGRHIYMTREDGTTFVLEEGNEYRVVAKNELDEFTIATPVFVDGRLYLRTYEHLYCIGPK